MRLHRDPQVSGVSLIMGGTGGRGAWLCRGSLSCLERAIRQHAIDRALRVRVTDEAVQRMRAAVHAEAEVGGAEAEVCEDGRPGRRRHDGGES